jgi:hypothetical protein
MSSYLKDRKLSDYKLATDTTRKASSATLLESTINSTKDGISRAGEAYKKSRVKTVVKRYSLK